MKRAPSGGPASDAPPGKSPSPTPPATNGRPSPSASDPFSPVGVTSESALPPEDPLVLDEIDRIIEDLQTHRGEVSPAPGPVPWAVPYPPAGDGLGAGNSTGPAGSPSGYLEEHLLAARKAVGHIDEQVGELEKSFASIRQRVSAADTELDRVAREYSFQEHIRGAGTRESMGPVLPPWSEAEPDRARLPGPPGSSGMVSGSFTAIRAASDGAPPPAYERFTVDRYNRTVESLRGGRAKLAAWTLGLSAAIGAVLVVVVLYSPIVNPPIWIATLPLVWIIPIPYFVLAFRGTHRVLDRQPLSLPEAK